MHHWPGVLLKLPASDQWRSRMTSSPSASAAWTCSSTLSGYVGAQFALDGSLIQKSWLKEKRTTFAPQAFIVSKLLGVKSSPMASHSNEGRATPRKMCAAPLASRTVGPLTV